MSTTNTPRGSFQQQLQELRGLVQQAKAGGREVLPKLRKFLATMPGTFLHHATKLATNVEDLQVDVLAGDDPQRRELVIEKINSLKKQLVSETPSPLEQLLVDRVVCCWSAVFHAELMLQHVRQHSGGKLTEYDRRLDRANRRFCFAVRQLGMFQRVSSGTKHRAQQGRAGDSSTGAPGHTDGIPKAST